MSQQRSGPLRICFCDVPRPRLEDLARRRYLDGLGTLDLLCDVETAEEKEWVCLVGLLDVSPATLAGILQGDPDRLLHVLSCRGEAIDWLAERGVGIAVKRD